MVFCRRSKWSEIQNEPKDLTPPLRITIVTGFFLPVPALSGGATERSWYGLAKRFAEAGHTVTFVSRRWPGLPDMASESGINHVRVSGFDHTRRLAVNLVLDFFWGVRAASALPKADMVICNTISLPVWLRLMKPSAGKVAVMIGRSPKGQVHFYRGVERIYAPSSYLAGQITSNWASKRIKVIGYPIEWGLHERSAHQMSEPVTVGFVGRLHPEKGISLLVRAAGLLAKRAGYPEWRLRIVGPAGIGEGGGGEDWLIRLKNQAEALGVRAEWLGPEFDERKLAGIYGGMDVFCYPSLAEKGETFGVSVAEAMAARSAVIVSALGCFSDLVSDGVTGLVFDHRAREPENLLADCIGRLVNDRALRTSLAAQGQVRARRYDYSEVSTIILEDLAFLTGATPQKPQ
jgi:glycosyltransferase involved in cell wall biosynthesis